MASFGIDRVLVKELETVTARQTRLNIPTVSSGFRPQSSAVYDSRKHGMQSPAKDCDPQGAPVDVRDIDTFGVCFSGGGLRSAAFSSGVLRALATSGWLSKVDYISCVSGGACSAASFFSHAACRQRKTETDEEKGAGIDAKELADLAERSLHQLRRSCSSPLARSNAGEMILYALQVACVLLNALVISPLMIIAVSIMFSRTVDALLGDGLRNLLINGFVDVHWLHNGWLVFLGPIFTASTCLSFAQLQRRNLSNDPDGLKKGTLSSPAGQIALVLSTILFAMWAVVLLMFLDERLFRGTFADEAVQIFVALLWAWAVVRLVIGSPAVNKRRDMLISCLWSLMGFSALWIAARIHVVRINGRMDGMRTDECAIASFLILALIYDYLSRSVHPLLRQRLRAAFFCNTDREDINCANMCRNLLEPPQIAHGKEERWCGNASWHGKNSPTTSQSSGDMHRARLEILSSNIGDAYYGHKHQIVERMPQRALPRDEQAVFLQEDGAQPGDKCDPALADLDVSILPYLLINTVASGYVKKRILMSRSNKASDVCQFLLSPHFCGSERIGYLQTPPTLSLSSAIAMSCNNDPFAAASSDMGDSLQHRFPCLGLRTGDWLTLAPRPGVDESRTAPLGDANPTPNFFLDPTGTRPMPRASRPPLLLSRIPPWVMRGLAPALAFSTLLSIIDPTFLLIPMGMALAALLLSFLPEGSPLLLSPQLRGMHQLLGAVHSSDKPPPMLYLSDGNGGDALGLLELLRRRCDRIFVCDASLDAHHECLELQHAFDKARCELGCAFLPTHGCSGDVSTVFRDFQGNANARTLHVRVHYFARQRGVASPPAMAFWGHESWGRQPQEVLVKTGDLFLLKCRATPSDKDLPLRSVDAYAAEGCPMTGQCAPPEGLRGLLRKGLRVWRTSCVDAEVQDAVQEPSHRFCSQQTFTRYSALGARAAWSALEEQAQCLEEDRCTSADTSMGASSGLSSEGMCNVTSSPANVHSHFLQPSLSPMTATSFTLMASQAPEYVQV